jgi:acyl dehydratase
VEINYGFDKVRFLNPVPVSSHVRGHFTLLDSNAKGTATLKRYSVELEIHGTSRPALVAEWLVMLDYPQPLKGNP